MAIPEVSDLILAAGGVGTAAMGIVETMKASWLPAIGFNKLDTDLKWADDAYQKAYGSSYSQMLESLFRNGRGTGDLPRVLRQGVRIGLRPENAEAMAGALSVQPGNLKSVVEKVASGTKLSDEEKNVLGRFEVSADARIDAALSLAETAYVNGVRGRAFVVAFLLSFAAALTLHLAGETKDVFLGAAIVALVSVPLAPIAKDVAKGFQAAASAIGGKK